MSNYSNQHFWHWPAETVLGKIAILPEHLTVLYIDDLISEEKFRGQCFGSVLLQFAQSEALRLGCIQVHLDTGYNRHAAHRVYLNHGYQMVSHHISLVLLQH